MAETLSKQEAVLRSTIRRKITANAMHLLGHLIEITVETMTHEGDDTVAYSDYAQKTVVERNEANPICEQLLRGVEAVFVEEGAVAVLSAVKRAVAFGAVAFITFSALDEKTLLATTVWGSQINTRGGENGTKTRLMDCIGVSAEELSERVMSSLSKELASLILVTAFDTFSNGEARSDDSDDEQSGEEALASEEDVSDASGDSSDSEYLQGSEDGSGDDSAEAEDKCDNSDDDDDRKPSKMRKRGHHQKSGSSSGSDEEDEGEALRREAADL